MKYVKLKPRDAYKTFMSLLITTITQRQLALQQLSHVTVSSHLSPIMTSESVSLSWSSINFNGQITTKSKAITHTAITCGWTKSRNVLIFLSCDTTAISHVTHRCDLFITGSSTLSIQIQVELEVLDVAYNLPTNPNERAIMIFSVMINRPCTWLPASGEYHTYILHLCPPLFSQERLGMEKLACNSTRTATHGASPNIKSSSLVSVPAIQTLTTSKK